MTQDIVINPILWFMYNRMDLIQGDIIIKLVVDYYDDCDIEVAKDIVFKYFPHHRNVKRRGDNKAELNTKDILEALHKLGQEDIQTPMFVTATCNFPVVDMKNIDSSNLMHNLSSLKKEFSEFKQQETGYNTVIEEMQV